MEFKKRIGYDDPRIHINDCELCGASVFDEGYSDFVPEAHAFARPAQEPTLYTEGGSCSCKTEASANGKASLTARDMEQLVRIVTDRVMEALATAGV
jgi:L-fuculose-phosphate aldolase